MTSLKTTKEDGGQTMREALEHFTTLALADPEVQFAVLFSPKPGDVFNLPTKVQAVLICIGGMYAIVRANELRDAALAETRN